MSREFNTMQAAAHGPALHESQAKNKIHIAELEFFNKMAIGRELRMVELKEEINTLYSQPGQQGPYPLTGQTGVCDETV